MHSDPEAKDEVSALCPDDSMWYPGAIEKINEDGTFCAPWRRQSV